MLRWFRQMSVIARLRGLALMACVAMLALSSTLLWTGHQQRLADKQAAESQRIDLAHASVQWAYARQQFGKLNPTQAREHTLAVLERLKRGPRSLSAGMDEANNSALGRTALTLGAVLAVSLLLWGCIEATARDLRRREEQGSGAAGAAGVDGTSNGAAAMTRHGAHSGHGGTQGAAHAGLQLEAGQVAQQAHAAKPRMLSRGPMAYRQGATPSIPSAPTQAWHASTRQAGVAANNNISRVALADDDTATDAAEAAIQEVKRLRMAGAI